MSSVCGVSRVVEAVPYARLVLNAVNLLQVAQTSALTDRQEEERRILNLENAIKSV